VGAAVRVTPLGKLFAAGCLLSLFALGFFLGLTVVVGRVLGWE
jgi:hypothetical protein